MSKYTLSSFVAFLATTTLDGAVNESTSRVVARYTDRTTDVVSSTVEYQAPFSVNFGKEADGAGKLGFVISPEEDWTEESNRLAYSPAGDVFGSAAAMAMVGNRREREDFSVTTDVTVGNGPQEAGHRFGLAVLGGPHFPETGPFDPAASSYPQDAWFPAEDHRAAMGTSALWDGKGNFTPLGELYASL